MNKERPINLDIKTIRLPITAIASILHRISAVILWVSMAVFLPVLYYSLNSLEGFDLALAFFEYNPIGQFMVWGLLTAVGYYLCATVKHIIQDFGYFEALESGRQIAMAVFVVAGIFCVLSGVWAWL